jgi:cytochrome c biogenesis protein CcmG/thiol:disulfide interchange protein DsbE
MSSLKGLANILALRREVVFWTQRRVWMTLVVLVIPFSLALSVKSVDASDRSALQPADQRKPAPEFALQDSAGKTATLKDYGGKIVVLDFWATWCHGCKEEIPWFAEFQSKYGAQGVAVIGVSLDEEGWKVVKPFIQDARVTYRIVLGNDSTAQKYGVRSMPDTFLIDQKGRIAAAYTGMINKDEVERHIRSVLAER